MTRRTMVRPLAAGVVGFMVGLAFGGGSMLWDFTKRLWWALTGGGGESADWGEPLFYLAILGVPLGLALGTAAFVIAAIVEWMAARQDR